MLRLLEHKAAVGFRKAWMLFEVTRNVPHRVNTHFGLTTEKDYNAFNARYVDVPETMAIRAATLQARFVLFQCLYKELAANQSRDAMFEIGRNAVASIDAPEDAIATKLLALMPGMKVAPPTKGKGKRAKVGDSPISAAPAPKHAKKRGAVGVGGESGESAVKEAIAFQGDGSG